MKVESEIELIPEICNARPPLIRLWGALNIDRGRSNQPLKETIPTPKSSDSSRFTKFDPEYISLDSH